MTDYEVRRNNARRPGDDRIHFIVQCLDVDELFEGTLEEFIDGHDPDMLHMWAPNFRAMRVGERYQYHDGSHPMVATRVL